MDGMNEWSANPFSIRVTYTSVDGFRQTRRFKTVAGARKYAQRWIGETPELGSTYAVSADGIGKITSSVVLTQLFPKSAHG